MATETEDLSLISWPWPTYIELEKCWYICSTCWGFDLTKDLHQKHREKYHQDLIQEEGYRLKDSLITFIDDALTLHNEWSEGTSQISRCYQDRIAHLKKSASRNLVMLDDASVVFKFEGGEIFEGKTPYTDKSAEVFDSQKLELDVALLRIRDDHNKFCSMLESDSEEEICSGQSGKKELSFKPTSANGGIEDECKAAFKTFLQKNRTLKKLIDTGVDLKKLIDTGVDMKTIETVLEEMDCENAEASPKTVRFDLDLGNADDSSASETEQRRSCRTKCAASSIQRLSTSISSDGASPSPGPAAGSRLRKRASSSRESRPRKRATPAAYSEQRVQKDRGRPKKRYQGKRKRGRRSRKMLNYFK